MFDLDKLGYVSANQVSSFAFDFRKFSRKLCGHPGFRALFMSADFRD